LLLAMSKRIAVDDHPAGSLGDDQWTDDEHHGVHQQYPYHSTAPGGRVHVSIPHRHGGHHGPPQRIYHRSVLKPGECDGRARDQNEVDDHDVAYAVAEAQQNVHRYFEKSTFGAFLAASSTLNSCFSSKP